jgi:imidazolonepropionase-like amidohydrolase
VLFGTDVGYVADFDTAEEFEQMGRAGMDYRQILTTLTTAPAARFGARAKGRIERGMAADLVVLAGDPAADLRAFSTVRLTIRGGRVVFRER